MSSQIENSENCKNWEVYFEAHVRASCSIEDPAHDILHFQRVVKTAKKICLQEHGKLEVVVPAAWLHDLVVVPKNSPLRAEASKLSAIKAVEFLKSIQYPKEFFEEISHAISGHSYSANLSLNSLEAKIVQDADRCDAIGAIGIARCFATAGIIKRSFYSEKDTFCELREPNDSQFTVDHFFAKLLKLGEKMNTKSGKEIAVKRIAFLKKFLNELKEEVEH